MSSSNPLDVLFMLIIVANVLWMVWHIEWHRRNDDAR